MNVWNVNLSLSGSRYCKKVRAASRSRTGNCVTGAASATVRLARGRAAVIVGPSRLPLQSAVGQPSSRRLRRKYDPPRGQARDRRGVAFFQEPINRAFAAPTQSGKFFLCQVLIVCSSLGHTLLRPIELPLARRGRKNTDKKVEGQNGGKYGTFSVRACAIRGKEQMRGGRFPDESQHRARSTRSPAYRRACEIVSIATFSEYRRWLLND